MPTFNYKGRDRQGNLVNGVLEAASQAAVAEQLMQKSIIPVSIVEGKGSAASGSIDLESLNRLFEPKVQLDDLVIFSRQMYSLSKSGIPILRAINGLAETTTSPALKRTLTDVGDQLEKGRPLSSCLNQHPKIFNRLMISIIHVGENTGKLDDSFLQIAQYFEQELETQKRIKAAMRYPTFVLIAVGLALVAVNVFVIPTFAKMFEQFNAELPAMTKILIATSNTFVNYGHIMFIVFVGIVWSIKTYLKTERGDLQWCRYKLKIPHVGSILERSLLSRFCRSFSLMIQAGVPMTTGLNLVSDAVDNRYMGVRIVDMRRGIEKGESLTRVAGNSEMFTALVMQMISVGEETGRIDELLIDVSDYYDREVDYDLKNLTAKIEPILTGLVAGIVLVLALGIFTPMWNMMSAIKG